MKRIREMDVGGVSPSDLFDDVPEMSMILGKFLGENRILVNKPKQAELILLMMLSTYFSIILNGGSRKQAFSAALKISEKIPEIADVVNDVLRGNLSNPKAILDITFKLVEGVVPQEMRGMSKSIVKDTVYNVKQIFRFYSLLSPSNDYRGNKVSAKGGSNIGWVCKGGEQVVFGPGNDPNLPNSTNSTDTGLSAAEVAGQVGDAVTRFATGAVTGGFWTGAIAAALPFASTVLLPAVGHLIGDKLESSNPTNFFTRGITKLSKAIRTSYNDPYQRPYWDFGLSTLGTVSGALLSDIHKKRMADANVARLRQQAQEQYERIGKQLNWNETNYNNTLSRLNRIKTDRDEEDKLTAVSKGLEFLKDNAQAEYEVHKHLGQSIWDFFRGHPTPEDVNTGMAQSIDKILKTDPSTIESGPLKQFYTETQALYKSAKNKTNTWYANEIGKLETDAHGRKVLLENQQMPYDPKKIADATWDFSNFLTTGQNAGLSFAATQAAVRAKKEADAAKAKAEQRQDLISLLEQQQNYVQSVRAAAPIQQDRLTPSMRMLAQYRPSIPTAPVPQFSPTTMILGQKPVFATSTISASTVGSTPKALARMSDADLISLAHKLGIRI